MFADCFNAIDLRLTGFDVGLGKKDGYGDVVRQRRTAVGGQLASGGRTAGVRQGRTGRRRAGVCGRWHSSTCERRWMRAMVDALLDRTAVQLRALRAAHVSALHVP